MRAPFAARLKGHTMDYPDLPIAARNKIIYILYEFFIRFHFAAVGFC